MEQDKIISSEGIMEQIRLSETTTITYSNIRSVLEDMYTGSASYVKDPLYTFHAGSTTTTGTFDSTLKQTIPPKVEAQEKFPEYSVSKLINEKLIPKSNDIQKKTN